ncbi:MAG: hypothetical protein ABSA74_02765 [Candidatus Staskawiczbacteria bacterium]|jgi:hypothetical protein
MNAIMSFFGTVFGTVWGKIGVPAGAAVMLILLAFCVKGCGGDKPVTKSGTTPATSHPTASEPSLAKKAIEKFERSKARDKRVKVVASEGKAAEEDAAGVESKESLEDKARFEESEAQMEVRAVQAKEEKLASAKREKARLENQVRSLERYVRQSERSLAIKKNDRHPSTTLLSQIEDFEDGIANDNAKLQELRAKLDGVVARVEDLQKALTHPTKISRRFTDGKGKVVVEETE